jgi:hypothetical protein
MRAVADVTTAALDLALARLRLPRCSAALVDVHIEHDVLFAVAGSAEGKT